MKTLTINYLSHERPNFNIYWEITSNFINKIKNKESIKLNILCSNDFDYESYISKDIEVSKFICNNYMEKISIASKSDTEFAMKLDEDVFFSNFLFDKFIEISKNPKNDGVYWPLISLNTRFADIFIKNFGFDQKKIIEIENEFLKIKFKKNLWNQKRKYYRLNLHTIYSKKWNNLEFYKSVKKLTTQFKGIHPLRLSFSTQKLINDYIEKNLDLLFENKKFDLVPFENIYVTSSCYVMKTEYFKEYLKLKAYDSFDEVQLNNFINNKKINSFYIQNGFAIHTLFATAKGNKYGFGIEKQLAESYETNFVRRINKFINQKN